MFKPISTEELVKQVISDDAEGQNIHNHPHGSLILATLWVKL